MRIDLIFDESSSGSSSSSSKGKYTISNEKLSSLEEASKLTTPVARESKTAVGQSRKRKEVQEKERADYRAGLLWARVDYRGGGGRGGLRGALVAAAQTDD